MQKAQNKTLQSILQKIVEANLMDWDKKLYSTFWTYWTSYKTNFYSTPLWIAFGVEVVMPIEFLVPSLGI